MAVFPFLLGIVTFAINGMLSFYSFWNDGLGLTAPVAVGLTFASLAFAIFITVIVYFAIRDKY